MEIRNVWMRYIADIGSVTPNYPTCFAIFDFGKTGGLTDNVIIRVVPSIKV